MNYSIDVISLTILFFLACFLGFRFFSRVRKLNTPYILGVTLFVILLLGVMAQVLLLRDQLSYHQYIGIYKVLICTISSILLTQLSILSIAELTGKKLKTLWRMPFIGFFAGLYFEFPYVKMICLGFVLVGLFILLRNISRHRYLLKKAFWILPPMGILFVTGIDSLYLYNLILIWIGITGYTISTITTVHSKFRSEVWS